SSLSHSSQPDRSTNHVIAARQVENSSAIDETTVDVSKLSKEELEKALKSAEILVAARKNATEAVERELAEKESEVMNATHVYEENKRKWEELDGLAAMKEEATATLNEQLQTANDEFDTAESAFTGAETGVKPYREKMDEYLAAH
ncbi:hypothetical protein PFISCL1PPCAC_18643, partial [Pristionchus fissidentatus]